MEYLKTGVGAQDSLPLGRKRIIPVQGKKGMGARDVLLIGILLAAGAVLKMTVGTVVNFGMKPNFIIAMYCLIILIVKPRLYEAAVIGLLAGVVCQLFPGQPYINIISELAGAVAMSLLCRLPLRIGKISLKPVLCTFLATLTSGFAFIGVMYLIYFAGADVKPTPLATFAVIIFGTAFINSVIVQLLHAPMRKALKKSV